MHGAELRLEEIDDWGVIFHYSIFPNTYLILIIYLYLPLSHSFPLPVMLYHVSYLYFFFSSSYLFTETNNIVISSLRGLCLWMRKTGSLDSEMWCYIMSSRIRFFFFCYLGYLLSLKNIIIFKPQPFSLLTSA